MPRPRKNPNDPKWESIKNEVEPASADWKMLFGCALTGFITRGGFTENQVISLAKLYADAAYEAIK